MVQVMAWCHHATSHYLSQCWPTLPISFRVTTLVLGNHTIDPPLPVEQPWNKHFDIIIKHLLHCVCCFRDMYKRLALCALTLPSLRKSECRLKIIVLKYTLMIQIKRIPEKKPKAVREAKHIDQTMDSPLMGLTALSHYPNQCWFLISKVLWHSPESNIPASAQAIILYNVFENYTFKFTTTSTGGQWVRYFMTEFIRQRRVNTLSAIKFLKNSSAILNDGIPSIKTIQRHQ